MLTTIVFAGCAFLLALATLLALDFVFQVTANHGQDVITSSVTVSTGSDGKVYSELTVAAGATVNYVGMAGDPDAVKLYVILPTFSGTLTTTNSAGVADVVTLVANKPLAWNADMGWATGHFPNRNPWTNWAFANAGATDGTVKILIGRDDTP